MELTFHKSPFHILRCLTREVRFQEETSDTIVPDSYPDIGHIADCYADVILRGKDCRDRCVIVAGGIKGGILYIPEGDDTPRCLDLYIPFTIRFDNSELSEQSQIQCSIRVRSVDARMVNSRKASLRVNIGCELTAYENSIEEFFEPSSKSDDLQMKFSTYRVTFPLETGEKSFTVHDTIDFSGHPPVSQILKLHCELLQADQKIVGNKAIFKGSLVCKLLYLTTDHLLHSTQHVFPYSQYYELSQEYDEEQLQIIPAITGYDLEPIHQEEAERADIHVNILSQCVITGNKEIHLLSDAYTTKGTLHPQWKEYDFSMLLDQQCSTQTVRKQIMMEASDVIDTDIYWDFPVIKRDHDTIQISYPVIIHLLTDGKDQLQSRNERAEITQEITLADHCICHSRVSPSGELYATMTEDGIDVRCGAQICTDCYADHKLQTICGGTTNNDNADMNQKSKIIVRTVPADTLLWDLAKQYRTTEQEIMLANHLENDRIPAEMTVLLPVF